MTIDAIGLRFSRPTKLSSANVSHRPPVDILHVLNRGINGGDQQHYQQQSCPPSRSQVKIERSSDSHCAERKFLALLR
jgi:hypothetical protein